MIRTVEEYHAPNLGASSIYSDGEVAYPEISRLDLELHNFDE